MQRFVIALFAVVLLAGATSANNEVELESTGVICYQYISDVLAVYNLLKLRAAENYKVTLENRTDEELSWNFCQPYDGACGNKTALTGAVLKDGDACYQLTANFIPKFYAIDPEEPLDGIVLSYGLGPVNPKTNSPFNLTMVIECDFENNNTLQIENVTGGVLTGNITIEAKSKAGCPSIAYYQVANFITKYRIIFIIAGILIGIFECFVGLRLFKPTLFLTGFLVAFIIIFSILFSFILPVDAGAGGKWACFLVSIGLGALAGWLLVKAEKIGVFLLGAYLGVIASFLLYNLIFAHLNAGITGLWIFTIILALVGGAVAYFVFDHVIIIATSVGGAYIAVRSISLFIKKYPFPNEFAIARQIEYGDFKGIPAEFFVYFAIIIILAIGGIIVQYKHKKEKDEEKNQEQQYRNL